MKKADKTRQKRSQQKRERRAQSRKTKSYNPRKHLARYEHQAQTQDFVVEL